MKRCMRGSVQVLYMSNHVPSFPNSCRSCTGLLRQAGGLLVEVFFALGSSRETVTFNGNFRGNLGVSFWEQQQYEIVLHGSSFGSSVCGEVESRFKKF